MTEVTKSVTTEEHADALEHDSPYHLKVSPEDFDRQVALEEEASAIGVAAYFKDVGKARERGQNASTKAGQFMIQQLLDKVVNHEEKGLLKWFSDIEEGKARNKPQAYYHLKKVDHEVAAFIALRVVIDKMTREMNTTPMARAIGAAIMDDLRLREYREELPGYYDAVKRSLDSRTSNIQFKKRALTGALETKIEETFEPWPPKALIHVGLALLGIVVETTGIVEIRNVRSRNRTTSTVKASAKATEIMQKFDEMGALLRPAFLPTVIPPRPWVNPNSGGYWTPNIRQKMVKAFNRTYLSDLASVEMPCVYNAINCLQITPFRVCKPVLEVMDALYRNNRADAGLPPSEDRAVPEKPKDINTNEKARNIYRREAVLVHNANAKLRGKRIAVIKTLWVANKFKEEPKIYFPKSMDFRGRVYDMPNYLQPQGHDTSKGLLEFSEGKRLGETGAYWLAVHLANCYGEDKVSLDERGKWVLDNTDSILKAVEDPLHDRWWLEADKPFQFLQACYDWAGFVENGEDHVSHVAVAVDGSCNGLQNLSAALLDPVGGGAVNLIPSETPQDIYGIVAKAVSAKVDKDADAGIPSAMGWRGLVDRKVCKRPVMTLAYGAKQFGFVDQIRSDTVVPIREAANRGEMSWPFHDEDGYQACLYLAAVMWEVTGTTVIAAQRVMGWLQQSARIAAKANMPIRWDNPAGFPVLQEYRKMNKSQIRTMLLGNSHKLNFRTADQKKIDPVKMANSIAPNWVHSFDAGHMLKTVEDFCGHSEGVPSLHMVHDSYATHACDMNNLNQSIREAFVSIYSTDVLQEFYDTIKSQIPEDLWPDLPPPPLRGDLDITGVLRSDYFFA